MKTLLSIPLLMGALVAPGFVVAQDAVDTAPAPAVVTLPPVVVTATRTEQSADDTLAALTVISREEIARSQATDVADILRFQAGLDLGRAGGPGQQTSVFIRGGESNHTLVLIDGVRVNPSTSGGAALQNLTPDMIERIEIVKGPRSTLYGSDAIGGVINIVTRAGTTSGADVRLRAGSDQTRDGSARLGYGDERKQLNLFAQQLDTEGTPTCIGSDVDRGFRQTTVNLRGAAKIGASVEVAVRGWNSQGRTEYLSFCGGGEPVDQDYQNQVAAVDLVFRPIAEWRSTLTASRTEDDIQQNQANFLGIKDSVRTIRPTLDWHNVLAVSEAQRLSFGAQTSRENVDAESFGTVIEERRDLHSVFVQDELSLGRHRAVLGLSYADYEGFGNDVTWNAEYGFDLFTATRLIASAGSGFRAPDASDRFGFGGDPELDPERARTYEVGVRQLIGSLQRVELRAFQSDVDDLISVEFSPENDPNDDFGFKAINIDEYRNRGAELSWRFDAAAWSATASGIVQKPEDRSSDQQLLRRAKRSISASLVRHLGPHDVGLDVLGTSERPDIDAATGAAVESGGYALLNLTGGLQLDSHFRLEGRVENLLDKNYQTAAGFEQPGVGGYVSLRYGF
ncbi:MAG: TonB-dependent receptor domain-containing protein [Panacagrimonas sp.]